MAKTLGLPSFLPSPEVRAATRQRIEADYLSCFVEVIALKRSLYVAKLQLEAAEKNLRTYVIESDRG